MPMSYNHAVMIIPDGNKFFVCETASSTPAPFLVDKESETGIESKNGSAQWLTCANPNNNTYQIFRGRRKQRELKLEGITTPICDAELSVIEDSVNATTVRIVSRRARSGEPIAIMEFNTKTQLIQLKVRINQTTKLVLSRNFDQLLTLSEELAILGDILKADETYISDLIERLRLLWCQTKISQ